MPVLHVARHHPGGKEVLETLVLILLLIAIMSVTAGYAYAYVMGVLEDQNSPEIQD